MLKKPLGVLFLRSKNEINSHISNPVFPSSDSEPRGYGDWKQPRERLKEETEKWKLSLKPKRRLNIQYTP